MLNMKAIGNYIFCGSHTLGIMQSGYNVDRILEISDEIKQTNCYHFVRNFPNIPIILPSEWKSEGYVDTLAKGTEYDLFFANNPCSGLSRININASADNDVNQYFYDVINNIHKIKPKRFLMENAPTLVTTGFSILKDITELLGPDYYINIMNDNAGNHNVPMIRPRTIITGYRKDLYKGAPLYNPDKQPMTTVKDAIGDLYDDGFAKQIDNTDDYIEHYAETLKPYYDRVKPLQTVMGMLVENPQYDDELPLDWQRARLKHFRDKLSEGKGYWDKFPKRLDENHTAPSLTSASLLIHPIHNRDLNVREYARFMGYPDTFKFYTEEGGCQISPIQCIAQGVPVNFIKYVVGQMHCAVEGNLPIFENTNFVYQKNQTGTYMTSDIFDESLLISKYNIADKFSKKRKRLF